MKGLIVEHPRLAGFYLAAVVVALPHALRLPLWLTLFFICMVIWRFLHEHYSWYLPGRLLLFLVSLLLAAAIYKHHGYLFGRDPGVAMLFGLIALKFVEQRSEREANLTIMLLYLLAASAFLYSQSIWLGVYLVLAVVTTTAALMRLNSDATLPFTRAFKQVATLMALALPLALVIYVLFPRIQGSLWGLPSDSQTAVTGLSEIMRPGAITELSQSDAIAFRAEFVGQRPTNRELYWRAFVFWKSDGRLWTRGRDDKPTALKFTSRGRPYRYTVTLEPTNKRFLIALDLPASNPHDTRLLPGFVLQFKDPVKDRRRYTLTSYTEYNTGRLSPAMRKRALQLPDTISPRVRQLARQWRDTTPDSLGIAQQAMRYFIREKFVYTLKPPLMRRDPVDEFLFTYRRGFCEHFAAAFVTLMRIAGVPARVVAGYQGGEYNATGNYFIVRQADAHAWGEIWVAGRGWVRMDPTAAVAPERIELGIDAVRQLEAHGTPAGSLAADDVRRLIAPGWLVRSWLRTRLMWDALNLGWYKWTADYDLTRQARLLKALGLGISSELGLGIGVAASILLFGFVLALLLLRQRRRLDPIQEIYLRFCKKLAGAGLTRAPHEGAMRFSWRVASALPLAARQVEHITRLYVHLRYGQLRGHRPLLEFKQQVIRFKPGN